MIVVHVHVYLLAEIKRNRRPGYHGPRGSRAVPAGGGEFSVVTSAVIFVIVIALSSHERDTHNHVKWEQRRIVYIVIVFESRYIAAQYLVF